MLYNSQRNFQALLQAHINEQQQIMQQFQEQHQQQLKQFREQFEKQQQQFQEQQRQFRPFSFKKCFHNNHHPGTNPKTS